MGMAGRVAHGDVLDEDPCTCRRPGVQYDIGTVPYRHQPGNPFRQEGGSPGGWWGPWAFSALVGGACRREPRRPGAVPPAGVHRGPWRTRSTCPPD